MDWENADSVDIYAGSWLLAGVDPDTKEHATTEQRTKAISIGELINSATNAGILPHTMATRYYPPGQKPQYPRKCAWLPTKELRAWAAGKGFQFWGGPPLTPEPESHGTDARFPGSPPNSDRAAIEREMKRRGEVGELLPTITQEAQHLELWSKSNFPDGVHSRAGTIKNNLRNLYKSLKPAKT